MFAIMHEECASARVSSVIDDLLSELSERLQDGITDVTQETAMVNTELHSVRLKVTWPGAPKERWSGPTRYHRRTTYRKKGPAQAWPRNGCMMGDKVELVTFRQVLAPP